MKITDDRAALATGPAAATSHRAAREGTIDCSLVSPPKLPNTCDKATLFGATASTLRAVELTLNAMVQNSTSTFPSRLPKIGKAHFAHGKAQQGPFTRSLHVVR